MLKSHFNLKYDEEEVEVEEELSPANAFPQNLSGEHEEHEEHRSPAYPNRKLKKSEVSINLSMLGKTANGDGYTYLKAKITGLNLTDITVIKSFEHLQFVDVSNNNLTIDALQAVTALPYLILLHADKNLLTSAALEKTKYLQVIIVNDNNLTSVEDVYQPELSTLEAGNNNIHKIFFENRMPKIRCLDFRNNFIQDISDFDYPILDSLYLAGNKITSLEGLEKCVSLRILHVRNNPIKLLNGFSERLAKLQYINLRNCKVATFRQVKKLRVLPALDTLIMKGCPYMGGTGKETDERGEEEDENEVRVEMLAALPRLKRINKGVITPEERSEAKDMMMQWIKEGEPGQEEEVENEPIEEASINED